MGWMCALFTREQLIRSFVWWDLGDGGCLPRVSCPEIWSRPHGVGPGEGLSLHRADKRGRGLAFGGDPVLNVLSHLQQWSLSPLSCIRAAAALCLPPLRLLSPLPRLPNPRPLEIIPRENCATGSIVCESAHATQRRPPRLTAGIPTPAVRTCSRAWAGGQSTRVSLTHCACRARALVCKKRG